MDSEQEPLDQFLQEADDIESEEDSEGEASPPPKKKRRLNKEKEKTLTKKKDKKKKKSKQASLEEEEDEAAEAFNSEQIAKDSMRRKELKKMMLKYPGLNITEVLKLSAQVDSMSPEEVTSYLECSKIQMGMQKPLATAESIVGLMGMVAQRWFPKGGNMYSRFMNDQQLIAAVDEYGPSLGDDITNPLQILVRACGHVSDAVFEQSNFSPGPSN
jgi:hypothetical protein